MDYSPDDPVRKGWIILDMTSVLLENISRAKSALARLSVKVKSIR